MRKAVVLLSGGLDSTTCLAIAKHTGFACYALSFDYGQKHSVELTVAKNIAAQMGVVQHKVVSLSIGSLIGSALTDAAIDVPDYDVHAQRTPITYVPARNTIFLSIALGWAELLDAQAIFIGVTAIDYSGYPDCRPEYIAAFQHLANLATQSGVGGKKITLETPLIHLSKASIITLGNTLGVDYTQTISCYRANDRAEACGQCDSCALRKKGFADAGLPDCTKYFR